MSLLRRHALLGNQEIPDIFNFSASDMMVLSLRRLYPSFTGDVIDLYSPINGTASFAFDSNGELPFASMASHVGAGDGHLTGLVNQLNGDKFTGTTTQAPFLYESGVLNTQGGNPILRFNGSQWLQKSYTSDYRFGTSSFTAFVVVDFGTGSQQVVNFGNSGNRIMIESGNFYTEGTGGGDSQSAMVQTGVFGVTAKVDRSTSTKVHNTWVTATSSENSEAYISGDINNSSTIYIGRRSSGQYLNGFFGETFIYKSSIGSTQENQIRDNIFDRFGI